MNKIYQIERSDGTVEEFDAEKVNNYIYSGKKLKDMSHKELRIQLFIVGKILDDYEQS